MQMVVRPMTAVVVSEPSVLSGVRLVDNGNGTATANGIGGTAGYTYLVGCFSRKSNDSNSNGFGE